MVVNTFKDRRVLWSRAPAHLRNRLADQRTNGVAFRYRSDPEDVASEIERNLADEALAMKRESSLPALFACAAIACAALSRSVMAQERAGVSSVNEVNLVRNPEFEEASQDESRPKNWYPVFGIRDISSPVLAELVYTREDANARARCVHIRSHEAVAKQPYWSQIVPIRGGAQYRLSVRVRSRDCLGCFFSCQLLDKDGGRIWEKTAAGPKDTDGQWKELSISLQTPLHAAEAKIRCGMNAMGDVWFDNVRLVQIPKPRHQPFRGATFPCLRVTHRIRPDGSLDEWSDIERMPITRVRTHRREEENVLGRGALHNGQKDLSAVLQACYDSSCLYVAIKVKDDVFPHVVRPMSKGDAIKFGFDTMGQRSQRAEHDDLVFGCAPQGDELVFYKEYPTWRGINFPAIKRGYRQTPEGAVYELAIPWRVLGISNPAGRSTLDLSIRVTDEDGNGLKWLEWGSGLGLNANPSEFGTMVLLPERNKARSILEPAQMRVADGGCAAFDFSVISLVPNEDISASVTLHNSTHDVVLKKSVDAAPGVFTLPFIFDLKGLAAGTWHVTARLSGANGNALSTSRGSLEITPYAAELDRIKAGADVLQQETAKLRKLIVERSAAGVNTQPAEISLACAEHLGPFTLYDSHMLRFQDMAAEEMDDLITIVKQAIQELEAGEPRQARWEEPDVAKIVVNEHGQFEVDGKTVFLAGLMNQPSDAAHTMPFLKRIGVNLIGAWTDIRFCGRDRTRFDHSRQLAALSSVCGVARDNNCRVDILMGHGLPYLKWLFQEHPDLDDGKGHFIDYDISHPVAQATWRRYYAGLAPLLKELPELLAYDLANEPKFPLWTKHTESGYRSWLKNQYQAIDALNTAWGTSYESFDECQPRVPHRRKSPASWYDWCIYNRNRVTEFFKVLVDAIREEDKETLLHIKIVGEDMFFPGTQDNGMDRDMLMDSTEIQGTDVRPIPEALWSPFTASIDWVGQNMAFDFMKSTRPSAPIFDSEWHVTQTVRYRDHTDIPAEHIETALWLAHLHGMSANLTWYWSRENGPERKTWGDFAKYFRGSFLAQPLVVNAYGRTMVELNALSEEVSAFPAGPRPIRFYYSRPSAIQDPMFCAGLWTVYGAANFLGRGIGFLNDRQIEAGEFDDCEVLVVSFARFASDKVIESIERFIDEGGTVVMIGPESLTRDPWGRQRNGPRFEGPKVSRIEGYKPPEDQERKRDGKADEAGKYFLSELTKIVHEVVPPPEVAIVGEDGIATWGVETRTVATDAGALVYAINVSPSPIRVKLLADGRRVDWIRGTEFQTSTDLPPLHPVLIKAHVRGKFVEAP